MLIHTLPPRLMWRVIAIRADSIWRFVTYDDSVAWMPKSPNASVVPPLAAPVRLGWCCLRCLTLRGINMAQASPVVSVGTAAPVVPAGVFAGSPAGGGAPRRRE